MSVVASISLIGSGVTIKRHNWYLFKPADSEQKIGYVSLITETGRIFLVSSRPDKLTMLPNKQVMLRLPGTPSVSTEEIIRNATDEEIATVKALWAIEDLT
jgi:hypothetical protein